MCAATEPLLAAPAGAHGADEAQAVIDATLATGAAVEAIVLFDDAEVEREAEAMRRRDQLRFDDSQVLARKARSLRRVKTRALTAMGSGGKVVRDFSHLPMALVRFEDARALNRLRQHKEFRAVVPNRTKYPTLDAVSAGLIGQPAAQSQGATGAGTTVLVVDSGVNYTQPDFGPCTAPGLPASTCKVVYTSNIAGTGGALDTSAPQHGTNIAGIVVGVAPGARVASINVFGTSGTTTDALVLQAINWGIANQAIYNIRAINLSLGDGTFNTAPCANPFLNPYVTAVNNARAAGILTVASAGNEGYTGAIANPACTPLVVSVGAVYSQNWGTVNGSCTDAATAADQVCCFSNSASYLSLLAPGAFITAGGQQLGGTSQAAPFVAGAVAVLRAAHASETLDATVARLTTAGVPVTDARNGLVLPRLHLSDSVRPGNDDFGDRFVGTGASGTTTGTTVYASKESGEPNHGGNPGGRSVWWRWTAPADGQVALDSRGSSIDTLLGVYTGSSVGALSTVATNDDDGYPNGTSGLYFQAQSGTQYSFALDGKAAASGAVTLAWALNTSAAANLRITTSVYPSSVPAGQFAYLTVSVTNEGPQPATGVVASGVIPAQFAYVTGDAACNIAGAAFTCSFTTLLPNANAGATLRLRALSTGSSAFPVTVSSQVPDPLPTNNSSTAQAGVGPATVLIPLPTWALVALAGVLGTIGAALLASRRSGPRD